MAQGIHLEQEKFCCSLCLNLFNNPVTVPCGHCFCMNCINKHLDNEDTLGIYSCPRCREISMQRPPLIRNSMIEMVVDQLRKTAGPKDDPVVESYAGPEDVACDICSERKLKALKSCLQCLASFCEKHLQPHSSSAALRKHKLVEATADLEESICSQHQEVMKMFCRTDQCCICYVCSEDGHRGHIKVSTAAERGERQKELQAARQRIQLRIHEKEKDVRTFEREEEVISRSADSALITAEKVFTELIYTVEKKLSHIKNSIQSRQNTDVGRFKNVREKLEKEIAELNRKDAELDRLSHTENHTHFLLSYPSLAHLDDFKYQPSYKLRHQHNSEKVTAVVLEARSKLQQVLDEELEKILFVITGTNGVPSAPQSELQAAAMKTKGDPGQTTAEFVKSRVLPNRVNPTFNRSNSSQNGDKFMHPNVDVPDAKLFQTRATPKLDKKNFFPSKFTPDFNGHDFPMDKVGPKLPKLNFSPTSCTSNCPTQFSQARVEILHNQVDFKQKKVNGQGSISQHNSAHLDFCKPSSPEWLLARSNFQNNLFDLWTRSDFLTCAQRITLDPNTANPHLLITNENRKAIFVSEELAYPNHPERFAYSWQVLSQQSLTGRCYLEVRSGKGVMVALAYKDISRTGTFSECMFGQNKKSWALDCFKNSCEFRHNKVQTSIPGTWSSRVGVYLDHSAGTLCFYSVDETMTLLHRVKTTFTQPLHVGLWLSDGAAAKVCKFS